MAFSLLGLFILIEAMLIGMFHLYVVNPAAREFAQFLAEDAGRQSGPPAAPLLSRPVAGRPGTKPLNYFLAEARHDLRRHGGDLRITAAARPGHSGILWVKSDASARHWIGFVISRPEFGTFDFLLVRLLAIGVIGLAGTLFVIARINRPLARLAARAESIGRFPQGPEFTTLSGPREVLAVELAMRRMAADLHRLREEREVLLTGISHELRTPLARLVLSLELPDEMLPQQKAAMQADLNEMDQSLATFLALVRSDGREQPIAADICSFLDEMSDLGEDRYHLMMAWARPPEPVFVPYRPLSFERLARNLLDNASRYGARRMEITLGLQPDEVRIIFRDDGPGLLATAPGEGGSAPTRPGQGSGVGLILCQRIAALHDGAFTLANAPGGGVAACLTLPRSSSMLHLD